MPFTREQFFAVFADYDIAIWPAQWIAYLLCTTAPVSRWLLVIPFLWSLVGGSAAFAFGVVQDWVLLASGLVVVPRILLRDHRQAPLRYAEHGA